MARITNKASFKERYQSVMSNIAQAENREQLNSCETLKNLFLNQIEDFNNLNQVKDSLEGMLAMREYQIFNLKK